MTEIIHFLFYFFVKNKKQNITQHCTQSLLPTTVPEPCSPEPSPFPSMPPITSWTTRKNHYKKKKNNIQIDNFDSIRGGIAFGDALNLVQATNVSSSGPTRFTRRCYVPGKLTSIFQSSSKIGGACQSFQLQKKRKSCDSSSSSSSSSSDRNLVTLSSLNDMEKSTMERLSTTLLVCSNCSSQGVQETTGRFFLLNKPNEAGQLQVPQCPSCRQYGSVTVVQEKSVNTSENKDNTYECIGGAATGIFSGSKTTHSSYFETTNTWIFGTSRLNTWNIMTQQEKHDFVDPINTDGIVLVTEHLPNTCLQCCAASQMPSNHPQYQYRKKKKQPAKYRGMTHIFNKESMSITRINAALEYFGMTLRSCNETKDHAYQRLLVHVIRINTTKTEEQIQEEQRLNSANVQQAIQVKHLKILQRKNERKKNQKATNALLSMQVALALPPISSVLPTSTHLSVAQLESFELTKATQSEIESQRLKIAQKKQQRKSELIKTVDLSSFNFDFITSMVSTKAEQTKRHRVVCSTNASIDTDIIVTQENGQRVMPSFNVRLQSVINEKLAADLAEYKISDCSALKEHDFGIKKFARL